jgi:hypothetical protein
MSAKPSQLWRLTLLMFAAELRARQVSKIIAPSKALLPLYEWLILP